MNRHRKVLIIGAGLGGITTAAHLARSGYEVLVIEKNSAPGGRCSQIVHDGHRFDTGPTLYLIPEVFESTYAALGERIEDHLDLHRIDPTYQFNFDDGRHLAITANLKSMQRQMEEIEPDSFEGLLRYMVEGQRHYNLAVKDLAGRNFNKFSEYFNPKNIGLLFKLKGLVKHYNNIGNYFQHPYLKAAFTFQDMYLGLSPLDAPSTYSLLQYTELVDGVWFPLGGMYRIIESMVSIAESHGVRFIYDSPVKRIVLDDGLASGVILRDGSQIMADVVVANADLPYVYRNLLPDKTPVKMLQKMKYTCSAIMFYWGIDRFYPQLDVHNLFVARDYRASLNRVFKDKSLPDEPNFYVHAPARIDPTAAPIGKDTLMVLVPVGRLTEGIDQNWTVLKKKARSSVLKRLADHGLTDLENQINFEAIYTPHSYRSMLNLENGSAFGSLNHNFMQVGYLRPHNRHHKYKNLYFSGASTQPGSGLPLVLLSAKLTSERIIGDLGVPELRRGFKFIPAGIPAKEMVYEDG